jgi:hypothetical protein
MTAKMQKAQDSIQSVAGAGMKMNRLNPSWWLGALTVFMPILLAGCFGNISYEEKAGAFGADSSVSLASLSRPISVMVLPVSVQKGVGADAATIDAAFSRSLWQSLISGVDAAPATFSRVPLPAGGEADEVIRKAMLHEAGLLPPEEFAKVKGFALPDRFVYGNVVLEAISRRQLRGEDQTSWKATAVLRLVNGNDFSYVPLIGAGQGNAPAVAAQQAVQSALAKASK